MLSSWHLPATAEDCSAWCREDPQTGVPNAVHQLPHPRCIASRRPPCRMRQRTRGLLGRHAARDPGRPLGPTDRSWPGVERRLRRDRHPADDLPHEARQPCAEAGRFGHGRDRKRLCCDRRCCCGSCSREGGRHGRRHRRRQLGFDLRGGGERRQQVRSHATVLTTPLGNKRGLTLLIFCVIIKKKGVPPCSSKY